MDLPDASCAGALSWYSLLHLPPQDLPDAFAEFTRLLIPGGHLLIGFHVGTGHRVISGAYGGDIDLDAGWSTASGEALNMAESAFAMSSRPGMRWCQRTVLTPASCGKAMFQ